MRVERAGIDDIGALVQLRLAYLCEDMGNLEDSAVAAIERDLPGYLRSHLDKDLFVFVIREEQAIVSCAFLLVIEKPMSPAFLNGRTGTVLNVYTRPESRRKGYARSLMNALLDEARSQDLFVVDLLATEDGYPLYRSVGFVDRQDDYRPMKWFNR